MLKKELRTGGTIELLVAILCIGGCLLYCVLFFHNIAPFWFNPRWTTDDGLQQLFPFYQALYPDIFHNDLIFSVMKGYLAPLHWWIGYLITMLSGDPIMTGHWMMLIQCGLALGGIFGAVYVATRNSDRTYWWYSLIPAFFSVAWILHSRMVVQRMTGGLPRGWSLPIFALFFFLLFTKRFRALLFWLWCSCLLNPPAALIAIVTYGADLAMQLCRARNDAPHFTLLKRQFLELLLVGPLLIGTTLIVVHKPPELGAMVSLKQAQVMPEFQAKGGRFGFLPFDAASSEIARQGFRVFLSKLHKPPRWWSTFAISVVLIGLTGLLVTGIRQRRELVPYSVLIFGVVSLVIYFLARVFAFKLYVPDRHLTIPLSVFFILSFLIGGWRLWCGVSEREEQAKRKRGFFSAFGYLVVIALLVQCGQGDGLQRDKQGYANFNWEIHKRGLIYKFLKEHTPADALIAGQPTFIDGVQLLSARRAYATSETWHPFFPGYNDEIKRRMAITFQAHYAPDLRTLLELMKQEQIDYFVFERAQFRPAAITKAGYFEPLNNMVKDLAASVTQRSAFFALPRHDHTVVPYSDEKAIVVSRSGLEAYLQRIGNS